MDFPSAVRRRTALIWEGEEGKRRAFTYAELAARADRVVRGLKRLGLKKGDRVALYLPMVPEAVADMMAAAKLGTSALENPESDMPPGPSGEPNVLRLRKSNRNPMDWQTPRPPVID